jgi:hypothetical protein
VTETYAEILRRDKLRRLLNDDRRAVEFMAALAMFGTFGLMLDAEIGKLIVESNDYWAGDDVDWAAA